MLRTLMRAFMSPVAGPVGFALALAMCGLLVVTVLAAQRNEQALQARIAALTVENQRNAVVLHARLAACEGGPADVAARAASVSATPEERAQRLTGTEPVGFDVCARMESADRAVLESLK
jgi:Tfp pilus assembly protein PilX